MIKGMGTASRAFLLKAFLGFFFMGYQAFSATQKIALLTALETDLRIDLAQLEKIGKDSFGSYNYEFDIIHRASIYDLWQTLHSHQTIAVFWLSHAGCTEVPVPKFARQVAMPDINHFDATDILQEIHPNIRFLAIIACNSVEVIKKARTAYELNQDLVIKSFDEKISPAEGLTEAMQSAHSVIRQERFQKGYCVGTCPSYKGYPLRLKRSVFKSRESAFLPPVRIQTHRGKILGIFKGSESEIVEVFFPISQPMAKRINLDLIFETGRAASLSLHPEFADIEAISSWQGASWHIKPILQGTTTRILSYDGAKEMNESMTKEVIYEPFDCSPMPPLLTL